MAGTTRAIMIRRWGVGLGIATATGVIAALMGPFGNYEHTPLSQRLIYWPTMAWVAVLIFGAPLTLIEAYRPAWAKRWFVALAVGVLGCLPLAVVTRLTAVAMWPGLAKEIGLLGWVGQCLVISVPVVMIFWLVTQRSKPAPAVAEPSSPPPNFRGAVCLQMEDHYVRVHGQSGSQLVLMTLSDAIARAGRPGLQVHRSWWVALDAVERAVIDGRTVRLRLTNGIEAAGGPVSGGQGPGSRAARLVLRPPGRQPRPWLSSARRRP